MKEAAEALQGLVMQADEDDVAMLFTELDTDHSGGPQHIFVSAPSHCQHEQASDNG